MKNLIALLITVIMAVPSAAAASDKKNNLEHKVRNAPVTWAWQPILDTYTGNYYGVNHVNSLWRGAPHGRGRGIVLQAAIKYHVPWRLLLGVWGAESTWGQAWNNFGLIGPATGDLRHDAFYAAKLFDKLYRSQYGHSAIR